MSRGLRNVLLGRDPFEIEALHRDLYQATIYHGRRGLGIHALSAVDVALHDLVASSWDAPRTSFRRLAATTSGPTRRSIPASPAAARSASFMDEIARGFERALELGFRAIKMEAFFEHLVSDRELVGCIQAGRRLVGDDTTLLVDFGYRWRDWRAALWTLNRPRHCDLYLAEATSSTTTSRATRSSRAARDAHRRSRDGRYALRVPRVDRARPCERRSAWT